MILFSLLIGYIAFARFLTYQLIWVVLVLMTFYFMVLFTTDLCAALFSPQTVSGKMLKKTLSFKDRHLEQMSTITIALAKCSLLLLMIVALFNGSFGSTTPGSLMEKIVSILTGEGLQRFNIVPGNLLNAMICPAIGIYILRAVRRWLGSELLPKTISDVGIRASLVTLFSNIGYVLVILITGGAGHPVEQPGVDRQRPVGRYRFRFAGDREELYFRPDPADRTPGEGGDMIGIGGVEGDVRRINVRATEIQLSDRSTMIVPNSQLISQNVRNATMGNAQGW